MALLPQQENRNPAGPLRRVTTEVYEVEGDGAQRLLYRTAAYYADGEELTEQTTEQAGGAMARTLYRYDGNGRLAEQRRETNGAAAGRTVYLYDDEGRLSYTLSLGPDGREVEQTRRFYAADGSCEEEFRTDTEAASPASGEFGPVTKIRSRRDAAGRLIEMRFHDAEDRVRHRIVYHYNAQGRLTDMEQRTGDGSLLPLPGADPARQALLRKYAALFSPDTALTTVRYRYDAGGRCVEAVTWMGSEAVERRTAAYGDAGEQVSERRYGRDGEVQSDTVWEREYDERGNWVLEREMEGAVPARIMRRQIEYY